MIIIPYLKSLFTEGLVLSINLGIACPEQGAKGLLYLGDGGGGGCRG